MSLDEASKAYLTGFADGQKFAGWKEEAATINERERIIKLLEAEPSEKWFFVGFRQHIIALIKGQN